MLNTEPDYAVLDVTMPWWDPVLEGIHELDLTELESQVSYRTTVTAEKPWYEYEDLYLCSLFNPFADDILADAQAAAAPSEVSSGNTTSSAHQSTDAPLPAVQLAVPSIGKTLVNWSSTPLLGDAAPDATDATNTPSSTATAQSTSSIPAAVAGWGKSPIRWSSFPLLGDCISTTAAYQQSTDYTVLTPAVPVSINVMASAGAASSAVHTSPGSRSFSTAASEDTPVSPALAAALAAVLTGNVSAVSAAHSATADEIAAEEKAVDPTKEMRRKNLLRVSSSLAAACTV